jgi:hypothetical protein
MHDLVVVHRSDSTHHQGAHLSQPLVFRTLHGQLIIVRPAMTADTLLLAEPLYRLDRILCLKGFAAVSKLGDFPVVFHIVRYATLTHQQVLKETAFQSLELAE